MIKKLRVKIIVYSFLSVIVVFLMGLAVLLGIGFSRLKDERIVRLKNELAIEDWSSVNPSSVKGLVLAEYNVQTEEKTFQLVGDNVNLSDQDIDYAVGRIVSRRLSEGMVGVQIIYAKQTTNDVVRIAIYDRNYSVSQDLKYVGYVIAALVVGSVCYLIICYFLSVLALRPVDVTWKRQKQFIADASHELKTPLAVIRSNADLIASHPDETVSSQSQWLENISFETERMTELVKDLLFLAKNDEGLKEQLDVVNMSECAESVVLAQEVLLYESGKKFRYSIVTDLQVMGSEGQLKQLCTILLDNANKYSVGEGNIELTLVNAQTIAGKFAELKVSNDCNEIGEEQLEHLFDRFYTVDQSRDKSHTGTGLGLAIAQTICENHGGNIVAHYADGRITFVAQLPLNRPILTKQQLRKNRQCRSKHRSRK